MPALCNHNASHRPISRTKVVATLGPSSNDEETIAAMLTAGMSVARLNMSHGTHESHAQVMEEAKKAVTRAKRPLAFLVDLQGPKIRTGELETDTVTLVPKKELVLTTDKVSGTAKRISVSYAKLPKEVKKGMTIRLDDGKIELLVTRVQGAHVHTKVVIGGTIRSRRGVNVPGANLSIPTISAKDKKDIAFAKKARADFITLSFVRSANDVRMLRKLLGDDAKRMNIVAKIETLQSVECLEDIIEEADVIMVARGDLAIEIPREEVPVVQKRAIRLANKAGKPVITATQMLDSMRVNAIPTRAEVNDIANAILDGTDAIMLSDETVIGLHPALAVETMRSVAHRIEECEAFDMERSKWNFVPERKVDAVSKSIVKTARTVGAKAIVAFSESGYTGRMVARYRPVRPIIVITPNEATFSQSLLTYGCEPELVKRVTRLRDALKITRTVLIRRNIAKKGDMVVIGAGLPLGTPGETNMMLVEEV
jgi:pyruvate kinase